MSEEYFKNALGNFTRDMANGGAIRHLWDLGYTVRQIMEELDYPAPFERIRQVVWEHLINTGVICLEQPADDHRQEHVTYVKEYDKYGRTSFRRVVEVEESEEETAYFPCDFGLLMHRDKELYLKMLNRLDERQREYVTDIPWRRMRVYHRVDGRMKGIMEKLKEFTG